MRQSTDEAVAQLLKGQRASEAALVAAGQAFASGRPAEAIDMLERLLDDAPPGPAGWIIPVDPMLAEIRVAPGLPALLAKLAARAA
jgi:hypothetical protein